MSLSVALADVSDRAVSVADDPLPEAPSAAGFVSLADTARAGAEIVGDSDDSARNPRSACPTGDGSLAPLTVVGKGRRRAARHTRAAAPTAGRANAVAAVAAFAVTRRGSGSDLDAIIAEPAGARRCAARGSSAPWV